MASEDVEQGGPAGDALHFKMMNLTFKNDELSIKQ